MTTRLEQLPLVSVVIPTYNRAELVCRAVSCVLQQTYPNWEIIVVDDGSTDDTLARLSQFGSAIRVVSCSNGGPSVARNRGIEIAQGEWIAFLDSDDIWHSTKLDAQIRALSRLGGEFGACFTNCIYTGNPDLKDSAFEQAGLKVDSEFGQLEAPLPWLLVRDCPIPIQSLVVGRSLAEEIRGFDEAMLVAEDTDFLFRLALRTRFCFVSAPLVSIDRTPARSVGLMELFHQRSERVFVCQARMCRKWLALPPDVIDQGIRESIHDHLRGVLYEWVIAKLHRRSLVDAIRKTYEIRTLGDTYFEIFRTLYLRAAKKAKTAIKSRFPQKSLEAASGSKRAISSPAPRTNQE